MSDGGPCSGCAELNSRINHLEGNLSSLASVIRSLETEMYGTTQAVHEVNQSIRVLQAETLASLLTLAQQLGVLDQSVHQVDDDVQRVSSSIAHSEIVKAVSDAGSQSQRIGSAQSDLLEHFEKALARIANSQAKFDRIDEELLEAYERDIRRLGQEIFDIWDRDFRQPVRGRLTSQARRHLDHAREALRQIQSFRRAALDNRLEDSFDQLTTFVSRRRQFEQDLRHYVTESPAPDGADLAIEALVFETRDPDGQAERDLVLGEKVVPRKDGAGATRYNFETTSLFSDLGNRLSAAIDAHKIAIQWRDLNPNEQDAIMAEFDAMSAEDLIPAEYAGLLREYLRIHPPAIIARADLLAPLPAAERTPVMPTQVQGSTIKVAQRHSADLFPTRQEEILRTVRLEDGFQVEGSIYCQQLTAVGPGTVAGPVLSRGDITLENRTEGAPQKYLSGIFCRSNLLCRSTPREPGETLAADIQHAEFLVCGDIVAERVSLHNAVVLGNVRGTTVQVNDSIILGGIVADEEAIISNSCFMTFESSRVRLLGRNSCLVPHGTAGAQIAWEDYTSPSGVIVPSEMRYVAVCRTKECGCECGEGDLACRPYMEGCARDLVRLSPRDQFDMDNGSGGRVAVLNIGGRVLNLRPIAHQLDAMTSFIREMLTYEHYDEASQAELQSTWESRYTPSEVWLLRQMADSVVASAEVGVRQSEEDEESAVPTSSGEAAGGAA